MGQGGGRQKNIGQSARWVRGCGLTAGTISSSAFVGRKRPTGCPIARSLSENVLGQVAANLSAIRCCRSFAENAIVRIHTKSCGVTAWDGRHRERNDGSGSVERAQHRGVGGTCHFGTLKIWLILARSEGTLMSQPATLLIRSMVV